MTKESEYQATVVDKIKEMFPGCIVTKQDSNYLQGIPDWCVFYGNRYAWLEIKRDPSAPHRPNQDYYVEWADSRAFGAFVNPMNEGVVLKDLFDYFN